MDNNSEFSPILFVAFAASSVLWWIAGTVFEVIATLLIWFIGVVVQVQPLNVAPIRYITSALVKRPLGLVAAAISDTFTNFTKAVGFIRRWYPVAAAACSWAWNCVGFVFEFLRVVSAFMTGQLQIESTKTEKNDKGVQIQQENENAQRERREKRYEMKRRGKGITRRAIERLERDNMRIRRMNKRIEAEGKEKEAEMKAEYQEQVENLKTHIKDLENENKLYSATFTGLEQNIEAAQGLAKTVSAQLSEAQGAYRTERKKRVAREMEVSALQRMLAEKGEVEKTMADTLKTRADRNAYLLAQNTRLQQEIFQLRIETAQGTMVVREPANVEKDMRSIMAVMEKLREQHGNDMEGGH